MLSSVAVNMARTRSIKPGFFHDVKLTSLPPLARLLFAGLWCYADRDGRLVDDPRQIKHDILPDDRCDVEKFLTLLASEPDPFILRYEHQTRRYIQIRTWKKHQNPHLKEPGSTIPAYCFSGASTRLAPDLHQTGPVITGASPAVPITLNPEPVPITGNLGSGAGCNGVVDLAAEGEILRTHEAILELFLKAGKPVPENKKLFCFQWFLGIGEEKQSRFVAYVQRRFRDGSWRSPATTKAYLNLISDGDWDVPDVDRTLPRAERDMHPRDAAQAEATRRFLADIAGEGK